MTAIDEMVCNSQSTGRGHALPGRATRGGTRDGQEAPGVRGDVGKDLCFVVLWEGMGEAGQLNNFSGLWGTGAVLLSGD